jgi:hypothetical protein
LYTNLCLPCFCTGLDANLLTPTKSTTTTTIATITAYTLYSASSNCFFVFFCCPSISSFSVALLFRLFLLPFYFVFFCCPSISSFSVALLRSAPLSSPYSPTPPTFHPLSLIILSLTLSASTYPNPASTLTTAPSYFLVRVLGLFAGLGGL